MGFLSSHPHTFSRVTQLGWKRGRGGEKRRDEKKWRLEARRLNFQVSVWRPRPPPEKLRNSPTIRTRCQLQLRIPRKLAALRYRPEFAKKKRRNSEKVNRHKNDKRIKKKKKKKTKKKNTNTNTNTKTLNYAHKGRRGCRKKKGKNTQTSAHRWGYHCKLQVASCTLESELESELELELELELNLG
ncbi:hypothetical protein FIM1_325 [Kluyveromyces marxianus]|uniref:Uncharacterized protein n=1 Tax=Kluyveromyces marxianus TaxID=4911 RepID=A0ABX6EP52_KLUMA|nr:hypothetical protein FIM1_325 [Kluyveromyces marxianus]